MNKGKDTRQKLPTMSATRGWTKRVIKKNLKSIDYDCPKCNPQVKIAVRILPFLSERVKFRGILFNKI